MSFLLDQCVPRRFVKLLQAWGYAASPLTAWLPSDTADPDVIALAQKLDAVLVTVDLDFSNILDYPPDQYAGIIVLRYDASDEEALDTALKSALDELDRDALRRTLLVISPGRFRIRR